MFCLFEAMECGFDDEYTPLRLCACESPSPGRPLLFPFSELDIIHHEEQ
jgi:hypothetical protein